jgi:hypothetical protein
MSSGIARRNVNETTRVSAGVTVGNLFKNKLETSSNRGSMEDRYRGGPFIEFNVIFSGSHLTRVTHQVRYVGSTKQTGNLVELKPKEYDKVPFAFSTVWAWNL